MANEVELALLLKALNPVCSKLPDGWAKLEAFLKSGADLTSIRAMLAALDLVKVGDDGIAVALTADEASAAAAAADPRSSTPLVAVPIKTTKSLAAAIEKMEAAYLANLAAAGGPPAVGTECKRKACKNCYQGEQSNETECKHHPGKPVFHDCEKYWTCCADRKRVLDFNDFLNIPGCTVAPQCLWYEEVSEDVVEKQVRMDHFETPKDFVVSFFTKCADPEKTEITVNEDTLSITTAYEHRFTFTKTFHLKGTVVPGKCKATISPAKIDVTLSKTYAERWDAIEGSEAAAAGAATGDTSADATGDLD
mmetsp:Transcript_16211/g.42043  ORF Transcript_16211/g.42043 Transcript_16211/m.42043 type:complete len:308 (+) Transcript_16211:212-1135(+)|eukprot:CAMPEP_0182923498 /NCGR_PEP_ID=MMETSP0105_2-20130417/5470_1 /TAXON_ID=81532 ORGANISM="Acanthoeca-like sp., Strain 10tr" /NCGR_SAMPLE_ID=MMETSP0105_2 /ASSEMBLY_ACC=CAM_ASM_000205 /LENGTH=307 /DNA_ID=CAMNT_0025061215 /DNA_START=197 /DNA_END=1120 /DNA_ORIENTATION=+